MVCSSGRSSSTNFGISCAVIALSVMPGQTAFTLILSVEYISPRMLRISPRIACFDVWVVLVKGNYATIEDTPDIMSGKERIPDTWACQDYP